MLLNPAANNAFSISMYWIAAETFEITSYVEKLSESRWVIGRERSKNDT